MNIGENNQQLSRKKVILFGGIVCVENTVYNW